MTKEVSQLARQLLGTAGAVEFYTQQEFDAAVAIAKAEIMTVATESDAMKTTEEKDSIYAQGFDMGVNFVLTAIILHFEQGEDMVESLKAFIDPELDKAKQH